MSVFDTDLSSITCCFTGHRRLDGVDTLTLRARIEQTVRFLIDEGYTRFCAGGALGFDTLAAQTVLALRAQYPQIRLILMLPCRNQHQYWSPKDRAAYLDICGKADEVTYTAEQYSSGCMHKRNRALVEASSACICYVTQNSGGTYYTVQQARKGGLHVINVADISSI